MNEPSEPHPRVAAAIRALVESGVASEVVAGREGRAGPDEARIQAVGDADSSAAVLAPLGFGELPGGRGIEYLFAAYDPVTDRWIQLRMRADEPRLARRPPTGRGRLEIMRRIRAIPGSRSIWVALVGPDGSGKSTLAALLAASLPVPVSRFYGGLYPVGRRRHRLPGLGTAATLLRLWRTTLRATVASRRGRLVLFDRHPLGARLRSGGRAGPLVRWRSAVLTRACPRPDLLVVLDAPVEILRRRRREQPADVLEAQRRAYGALAGSLDGSVVVDVSGDLDAVRRRVTDLIWRRYAELRR